MAALLLLRLAPVLTTTAYLTFTCAEDLYFKPYLSPPLHKVSNDLLPLYINIWYTRGMILIFTLYGLTWATAIANLPVADLLHASGPCFALYLLGLVFSIGHMVWGPKAMALLNAIKMRERNDGSVELVREWCRMNIIRGIVVDVPAWGCFLAAFLVWGSGR